MKNDIMLDLETMDNVASSAIVSIGAVECNLITGEIGEKFYRVINLQGQQEQGLTICHETLYWWMDQSEGARQALIQENKITALELCNSFIKWIDSLELNNGKYRLWGNGASFDNAILRNFFKKYHHEFPISFWNDRDMRTIVGFYPYQLQETWKRNNLRKGTFHNALDDALYQVKYCSNILQELGVKELY